MVAGLHSPVEREVYGARCAELAGISAEAMAQEVKGERTRRARKELRQQERRDLTPAVQLQPQERSLRYENIRSARAEEGVLRLVLLDPELFRKTGSLTPEHFSSPLLGKTYRLLRERWEQGPAVQLSALAGELEPGEMSCLAGIVQRPESLQNGGQAMADYIDIIEDEAEKRSLPGDRDALLTLQKKLLEKKAYGGYAHE